MTIDVLINSMAQVDEWELEPCTLHHKPSGLRLFTGGGWLALSSCLESAFEIKPSFVQRWKLWPHAKRLQDTLIAQKIIQAPKSA